MPPLGQMSTRQKQAVKKKPKPKPAASVGPGPGGPSKAKPPPKPPKPKPLSRPAPAKAKAARINKAPKEPPVYGRPAPARAKAARPPKKPTMARPAPQRAVLEAKASIAPVLTRNQFRRLQPTGVYGDYVEFVADRRGTTTEVIQAVAPRHAPGTASRIIRKRVERLESFFVGGKQYRVELDWLTGEIPSTVSAGVRNMIQLAKQWLGDPYLWGGGHGSLESAARTLQAGKNAGAFDCSGFTRALYASAFGIDIGGVTYEQVGAGRSVLGEQLKAGDLVFFGSDYHHMGLYLGEGLFIHAPQTGDVIKISKIQDRPDLSEARRIVG